MRIRNELERAVVVDVDHKSGRGLARIFGGDGFEDVEFDSKHCRIVGWDGQEPYFKREKRLDEEGLPYLPNIGDTIVFFRNRSERLMMSDCAVAFRWNLASSWEEVLSKKKNGGNHASHNRPGENGNGHNGHRKLRSSRRRGKWKRFGWSGQNGVRQDDILYSPFVEKRVKKRYHNRGRKFRGRIRLNGDKFTRGRFKNGGRN